MSRILVIEQEEEIVTLIKNLAKEQGWSIVVVNNQDEALAAMAEQAPDAIVANLAIPEIDQIVFTFSRHGGGPGIVGLVPQGFNGSRLIEYADISIHQPYSRDELLRSITKIILESTNFSLRVGDEDVGGLSSEELFGDVVKELEGAKPTQPSQEKQKVTVARSKSIDYEETVSLEEVIKRRKAKIVQSKEKSVEELLNKTLSGLKVKRKKTVKHPTKDSTSKKTSTLEKEVEIEKVETTPSRSEETQKSEGRVIGKAFDFLKDFPDQHSMHTPKEDQSSKYDQQFADFSLEEEEVKEGSSFGNYIMLERIAVGGMAEVWKAKMKGVEGFEKIVAIKKILPHLTDSAEFVTMFIDEAKLAAQLNHNNIIHIYDLGKIGNDYFIAMEYIDGKDLRTIMNRAKKTGKPFPLGLAVLIAARLASALDYAHRKKDIHGRELGLVHRDVSPQNVLVSFEGDIKLCDFGIVKAVTKASKTQVGALKGKIQYMSPEQAWGKTVDARSDIFSLGAVLFEMLTGRRLFAGDSELSVLQSVRECKIVEPKRLNPSIPLPLNRIVMKALAPDPDDRYQSAGEMQKDLEEFLYSLKPTPTQSDLAKFMADLFPEHVEATVTETQKADKTLESKIPIEKTISKEEEFPIYDSKLKELQKESKITTYVIGTAVSLIIIVVLLIGYILQRQKNVVNTSQLTEPVESISQIEAQKDKDTEQIVQTAETTEPLPPNPQENAETQAKKSNENKKDSKKQRDAIAKEKKPTIPPKVTKKANAKKKQTREKQAINIPKEKTNIGTKIEKEKQLPPLVGGVVPPSKQKIDTSTPEQSVEQSVGIEKDDKKQAQKDNISNINEKEVSKEQLSTAVTDEDTKKEVVETQIEQPIQEGSEKPGIKQPSEPLIKEGDIVPLTVKGLVLPKVIGKIKVNYPPVAIKRKIEGTVIVRALIGIDGKVEEAKVIGGSKNNILQKAALDAIKRTKFTPAKVGDVKVRVWITKPIKFKL